MRIVRVDTKRRIRDFAFFPKTLYEADAHWIPPIWSDELAAYEAKTNPILAKSNFELVMCEQDGRILGRNLVYEDNAYNEFYEDRIGFFGAFECVNDPEAARVLLEHAESWCRSRGLRAIRGPIHPAAEVWGFLNSGYGMDPVFLSPYNPPYYHGFMQGYDKVKDLLVYEADAEKGYVIPERFLRFRELFSRRHPEFTIRRIDLGRLDRDARIIWELSNLALKDNWGYVPADEKVMRNMVRKLKVILDPDAVWFVEDRGKPVAFCLGFPDLNVILKRIKGNLLPFGFLEILLETRKIKDYRLFGLAVDPAYHGMGVDVLLYLSLYEALKVRGVRLEANYILEDNYAIKNALEKLGLERIKEYRIYEKPLS